MLADSRCLSTRRLAATVTHSRTLAQNKWCACTEDISWGQGVCSLKAKHQARLRNECFWRGTYVAIIAPRSMYLRWQRKFITAIRAFKLEIHARETACMPLTAGYARQKVTCLHRDQEFEDSKMGMSITLTHPMTKLG